MKLDSRRLAAKSSSRRIARRPLRPTLEAVERRTMLAANFLQGVSFIDNNGNNLFDAATDTPKPGVTIELRESSTNALIRTTSTNPEGYYRFDGLASGKYRLVELPTAGHVSTNAEIKSVFNNGTWTGNAIEVTMPDPALAAPFKIERARPGIAGGYTGVNTAFTLDTGLITPPASNIYSPTPYPTNAQQFEVRLLSGSDNTQIGPDFYTYCFDLYHLSPGRYGAFEVTPETVPQNLPPAVTTNLGRIGWLYNHHGKNLASSGADGAGMQLAFYELTYDSTPDLLNGQFRVNAALTDPAALAAAQAYLDLSAGRDERSIFLNTTDPIDTGDVATWGTQGLMTTESFNFVNTPAASIGDVVWLDANANGRQDSGEAGVAGVTVRLLDPSGNVLDSRLTDADGAYLFSGLRPGDYAIQFVAPTGYALTARDQGADDRDSDADPATGRTVVTNLASGEADLSWDAGLKVVTGSIRGTKYNDLTGNGLTPDDAPLKGVTIYLDANKNGRLDAGELSTKTAADGSYAFTGLAPGVYVVREVVASGWIRTGPVLADNYVVTVAPGSNSVGKDFANTEVGCDCQITNVVYIINGCRQVSDLRGKVNQGDTVTVRFTVRNTSSSNPATFSLVSYTAPDDSFSASDAYKQEVFDMASMTYTSNGTYTLQVDVPDSFFQVDFVCGQVIDRFGPANSNIFYTPQGRLISADNGGCRPTANAVTQDDIGTPKFWAGTSGQNLIKSLNGGSSSKSLGNWLAGNFSNLYGGLAGKTNAEIASYFKTLNGSSSKQLEAEIMATALSVYVTDVDLAGMAANAYGFHVSYLGTGVKKFSVGSTGSVLGLSNNTKYSVWTILDAADAKASNGTVLGSSSTNRSKADSLFTSLNDTGALG